jgi:hypothetical protein
MAALDEQGPKTVPCKLKPQEAASNALPSLALGMIGRVVEKMMVLGVQTALLKI